MVFSLVPLYKGSEGSDNEIAFGKVQSPEHSQSIHFVFSADQIFRLQSEHVGSDGKSLNRGLLVLDLPGDSGNSGGRGYWC